MSTDPLCLALLGVLMIGAVSRYIVKFTGQPDHLLVERARPPGQFRDHAGVGNGAGPDRQCTDL